MNPKLIPIPVIGVLLMLAGCATQIASELGLTDDGKLAPCPATPNCVSSDATDSSHRIKPLEVGTDPKPAWQALIAYLKNDPSYVIQVQKGNYLRAEARTKLLGFVDDVEFQLRPAKGQIAMRSASRVGYSDLGTNRRRLEAVRQALQDANVLRNLLE